YVEPSAAIHSPLSPTVEAGYDNSAPWHNTILLSHHCPAHRPGANDSEPIGEYSRPWNSMPQAPQSTHEPHLLACARPELHRVQDSANGRLRRTEPIDTVLIQCNSDHRAPDFLRKVEFVVGATITYRVISFVRQKA